MTLGFIGLIAWTVLRNYVLPWLVERLRQPRSAPKAQSFTAQAAAGAGPLPRLHESDSAVPPVDLSHELHLSIPLTITITPRPPGL